MKLKITKDFSLVCAFRVGAHLGLAWPLSRPLAGCLDGEPLGLLLGSLQEAKRKTQGTSIVFFQGV